MSNGMSVRAQGVLVVEQVRSYRLRVLWKVLLQDPTPRVRGLAMGFLSHETTENIALAMRDIARHFSIIVMIGMSLIGFGSKGATASSTTAPAYTASHYVQSFAVQYCGGNVINVSLGAACQSLACEGGVAQELNGGGNPANWAQISGVDSIIGNICTYHAGGYVNQQFFGTTNCPSGFTLSGTTCTLPTNTPNPVQSIGHPPMGSCQGDPCDAGTGNQYENESDYVGIGPYPLQIVRTYNSGTTTPLAVETTAWGSQWRGYSDRSIVYNNNGTSLKTASLKRDEGKQYYFNQAIGTATPPLTTTT